MVVMGDFCLMAPTFPGSPGHSLLFKENDPVQIKRKGFHIPTYKEGNRSLQTPRKTNTSLPAQRRTHQAPPTERRNHARPAAGTLGPHHPGHLASQVARSHPTRENALPQPRTMTLKNTSSPSSSTRTGPTVTKAASADLTSRAAGLPTSMLCHHLHAPALGNAHRRNLMLKNPPTCSVRAHVSTTGACLGV